MRQSPEHTQQGRCNFQSLSSTLQKTASLAFLNIHASAKNFAMLWERAEFAKIIVIVL